MKGEESVYDVTEADRSACAQRWARPLGEAELRLSGRGKRGSLRMCPKKCLHARPPLWVPACVGTPSPLMWERGLALCAAVMRSLPCEGGTGDQARGKGIWWMPWH